MILMKSKQYSYKSNDELLFSYYLDELKQQGFVLDYSYEPKPFVLYTGKKIVIAKKNKDNTKKIKVINSKLFPELIYTTDFKIKWNTKKSDKLFTYNDNTVVDNLPFFYEQNGISYVEVKPIYDRNNMTRHVKIKIAWVYDKYGIYVNLITPEVLFKKSFYPNSFFYTKNGKLRKKKIKNNTVSLVELPGYKTINNYLNEFNMHN